MAWGYAASKNILTRFRKKSLFEVYSFAKENVQKMDIIPINQTQKKAYNWARIEINHSRCLSRPNRNASARNNNRRFVTYITAAKQNYLPPPLSKNSKAEKPFTLKAEAKINMKKTQQN